MTPETTETSIPQARQVSAAARHLLASLIAHARRLTFDEWVALGLGALALVLRFWPLGAYSSEFDEGVYWQSLRALAAGHPLFGAVFSSQPPAFLLSIFPFYAVFGQSLGAARFGVALLSMLGPVGFYLLGRSLGGRWAGVLAGAFLAFDPLYLLESHTLQAEAPALGWLALAVALAALAPRTTAATHARALAFGAGVCLALGTLTKLFDVVGIVPVVCYLGLPLWSTALAADGRPRMPDAAMLRARWVALRPLALSALVGLLLVGALVLLPFAGQWGALWHQVVSYHLAAAGAADAGVRANISLLATTLFGDGLVPVALLALLLLGIVGWRREWSLVPPMLWVLAALVLLVRQQPLFAHDITLVIPPLALLTALALHRAWCAVSDPSEAVADGTLWRTLARDGIAAGFRALGAFRAAVLGLGCVAVALGVVLGMRGAAMATSYVPSAEIQMAFALSATTPREDLIITDDPYAAALANRDVPPHLVDPSAVRIASGYLTARDLETLITNEDARTILFGSGRFAQIPGFQRWVAAHFTLVAQFDGGGALYAKLPQTPIAA